MLELIGESFHSSSSHLLTDLVRICEHEEKHKCKEKEEEDFLRLLVLIRYSLFSSIGIVLSTSR